MQPSINSPYADTALGGIMSQLDRTLKVQTGAPAGPQSGSVAGASTVDPYAQWGGKAGYDSQRAGYSAQKGGILDSVNGAVTNSGTQYKGGILDFLDSLKAGQNTLNTRGDQLELAKRQGLEGVTSMVGDGIRSSGVMLGNRNAGASSAVDALARAYSTLGQREANNVGNDYEMGQNALNTDQTNLNDQVGTQRRHNEETKSTVSNNILADASSRLAALDAAIAGASLPDRINIEAEKQSIRDRVNAALAGGDQAFEQGVAGVRPTDKLTRAGNAANLATAGVTADNPFNFTSDVPSQFQGTGDFSSNLPLFTLPRNKRTA